MFRVHKICISFALPTLLDVPTLKHVSENVRLYSDRRYVGYRTYKIQEKQKWPRRWLIAGFCFSIVSTLPKDRRTKCNDEGVPSITVNVGAALYTLKFPFQIESSLPTNAGLRFLHRCKLLLMPIRR